MTEIVTDVATLFAFVSLGVLSIPHCMLMCGPLAARACVGRHGVSKRETLGYVFGRAAGYAFIGVLAGTFGAVVMTEAGRRISIVLIEIAALVVFVQGIHRLLPELRLTERFRSRGQIIDRAARFLPTGGLSLGMATAFLPCGALATAVALAVATGDPLLGLTGMALFAMAGTPVLVVPVLLMTRSGAVAMRLPDSLSRAAGAALIVFAVAVAVRPFIGGAQAGSGGHCDPPSSQLVVR